MLAPRPSRRDLLHRQFPRGGAVNEGGRRRDWPGLAHAPSGPGVISESLVAAIAAHLAKHATQTGNRGVERFLLTSLQTAEAIAEQPAVCNTTSLQLVDDLALNELPLPRQLLPKVELAQVIHVQDEGSVQQALAPGVDMLLLDADNPTLAVKHPGGTGRTHHWQVSQRIVAASPVPMLLAGGENLSLPWPGHGPAEGSCG